MHLRSVYADRACFLLFKRTPDSYNTILYEQQPVYFSNNIHLHFLDKRHMIRPLSEVGSELRNCLSVNVDALKAKKDKIDQNVKTAFKQLDDAENNLETIHEAIAKQADEMVSGHFLQEFPLSRT